MPLSQLEVKLRYIEPAFCQNCRYEMDIKGERVFQVTQIGRGKSV